MTASRDTAAERRQAPSITLFFPVYRDERTVERVAYKALAILAEITDDYELIIIDDGSPDAAGDIADRIAASEPRVHVVHHETNRGSSCGGCATTTTS